MVKPTVISTFAGCGGSSLGYKLAGYRELLAIDWDNNAIATFRLNFPEVPVYHGDIAELTVDECLRLAGIMPRELDVLDGSPPCQGFSTAGKRKFTDHRNSLFMEFARLLRGLQPRVFILGNVPGLVKGAMKQIYLQMMAEFRFCGYRAQGELMNAMYYNVPQSRERIIVIGVREDLNIEPSHPKPQTDPIPVWKAFQGVVNTPEDLKIPTEWVENSNSSVAKLIPKIKPGNLASTVHPNKAGFNLRRLNAYRVSSTILRTCNRQVYSGLLPPVGDRFCTIPELKRLASFPDDFQFTGKFSEQWACIGNCVPPNFMRAIAEHVRKEILEPARKDHIRVVSS